MIRWDTAISKCFQNDANIKYDCICVGFCGMLGFKLERTRSEASRGPHLSMRPVITPEHALHSHSPCLSDENVWKCFESCKCYKGILWLSVGAEAGVGAPPCQTDELAAKRVWKTSGWRDTPNCWVSSCHSYPAGWNEDKMEVTWDRSSFSWQR